MPVTQELPVLDPPAPRIEVDDAASGPDTEPPGPGAPAADAPRR